MTFNACRHGTARAGDLVAILGVGSLGHLAVQFVARQDFRAAAANRGRDKEAMISPPNPPASNRSACRLIEPGGKGLRALGCRKPGRRLGSTDRAWIDGGRALAADESSQDGVRS